MVQEKDRAWLEETIEKVKKKMKTVSERSCKKIPTQIGRAHV